MTPTPHDALVKATFSQADNMAGELRAVLPRPLAERIDFATLQLAPGSFVDEALKERFTDLLYSAQIAERPALVYVLFEYQSGGDAWMAFLIRELMRSGGGAAALQLLFRYLVQTRPPTDIEELHRVVADLGPEVKETVMTMEEWLIQKGEQRGEQRGRMEGRVEAARQFLARLLTLKFGSLVEAAQARIQAADEATLGRWAERVLSATSLEEIWE